MSVLTIRNMLFLGFMWAALTPFSASAELLDMQGNVRTVSDYQQKDKWLVVMIWESNCPVCNREAYQYVDFYEFHKDTDANVLGISIDGAAKKSAAEAFIKRHSVSFPNLIGEVSEVARWYATVTGERFSGTPTLLVYAPDGTLAAREVGAVPTETIEKFMQREAASSR